ncbi:Fanconi anemia group D2 protein [Haplosporangium sp. Z 11]|nr:Fanconi anemia group D2 protein [Haplosporangium sp. Z 11]
MFDKESPIPKLILQQLKWLNNIIEPAQLAAKLIEVIGMSPLSVQRDIITSLPEIVPDSEHKTVVAELFELMNNSSELIVPVLDALSDLNLQSDMLTNARTHVLDKLESAELDDLPVVIKFLLQTVEPDTVEEMIETIRSNLDFPSINMLQKKSKNSKQNVVNQTPEVLILDALKTGIRFQKFVTDAWYKALAAIIKPKVESLIRKQIIGGQLTRKLLESTILVHGLSLREYMPAVLSISENLLRSSLNHPIVARAATALYTSAFQVSDAYYRQEIVGSLLVHIGSGSMVEIDASLAVLQNIVQVSRSTLNEYSVFIKGVLDYLHNLTLEQTRLFFVILGSLAREESIEDEISGNTGTLITDLDIQIRKQLSSPVENFKKRGVMGAIALVQAFGVKENEGKERGSSSQAVSSHHQAESDPLLKVSVMYLRRIKDCCQKSAICLALTFDELASMVLSGKLDPKLVMWIKEEFSNQFADTFVCAANETFTMRPSRNIAMERWMNLDGPESELSICIMPSLCADLSEGASQGTLVETIDAAVYLCALFKLMQATEKATSDCGLDNIDGLLGCGITMFKREYLDDIAEMYSTEICHMAAQGLLCAINWFREISNAFSYGAGEQTTARIILRLQQISEMEEMLRQILKSIPGFRPLEASHDTGMVIDAASKASSRGVPSISGILPSHSITTNATGKQSAGNSMDVDSAPSRPFVVLSNEIVTYEALAPFLRELEIDIFHVLGVHKPIVREVYEVSEAHSTNSKKNLVRLRYPELRFLLKDLLAKVAFKLPAPVIHVPFGKKPNAFSAGSLASSITNNNAILTRMPPMNFVMSVLKVTPHIVTKTRTMLKILGDEDECMDQDEDPVNITIVRECLTLSLKVLLALLSWNEIKGSDQKEIRLELLKSLALDQKSEQEVSEIQRSINLSAVAVTAFNNLATWREMMPDFESSVMLLEVIDKVLDLVPKNKESFGQASQLATEILSRPWPAHNVVKNDRLAFVLGQQIGKSEVRLEMINEYVTGILPSFLDQDEDRALQHPMLNTSTFSTYTKVLHIQLASLAEEFQEDNFNEPHSALEHIIGLARCFQGLGAFVKANDRREVLAVTLKHSKVFMEQFMKKILPFLGSVCGHAKASRDQTLVTMVPSVKKTLESFIFQVKLMLEDNDAGVAFWLGNLKHRNLAGEEISSQLPVSSEDEHENDRERGREEEGLEGLEDEAMSGAKESRKAQAQKNPRKRQRTDKPKQRASKASASTKEKIKTKVKTERKRPLADTDKDEDESGRVHTRSQITNSDMSEDEQDQLAGDEDEPERNTLRAWGSQRHLSSDDEGDQAEEGEEEEEEEEQDEYSDRMLEQQDERAERRRRIRNPYIDDAAMEDDDEEEEEEEEEEEGTEDDEDED